MGCPCRAGCPRPPGFGSALLHRGSVAWPTAAGREQAPAKRVSSREVALSYWDALVVAAARHARCRYLLTEDLQAGQELAGLEVVDPFERHPEAILGGD